MGTLYENIKALCDQRGIRPGKMCAEANISKGLITDLKMGRKKSIQIETAQKMAEYFDVPVGVITGDPMSLSDAMRTTAKDIGMDYAANLLDGQNRETSSVDSLIAGANAKKEPAPTNGNGQNMYDMQILNWFYSLSEEKRQAILALGDAPEGLRGEQGRKQSVKNVAPLQPKQDR